MVGPLAIESLHYQSANLDQDTRVRLDRTECAPVIVRMAPFPHR